MKKKESEKKKEILEEKKELKCKFPIRFGYI